MTKPDKGNGYQTAEYLMDHGAVDLVIARKDLPETFARTLNVLMA